jgi:hypothetical protein
MNSQDIEKIVQRTYSILAEEFNFAPLKIQLDILVDKKFYNEIKDNFPDRLPADIGITEKHENSSVTMLYVPE